MKAIRLNVQNAENDKSSKRGEDEGMCSSTSVTLSADVLEKSWKMILKKKKVVVILNK